MPHRSRRRLVPALAPAFALLALAAPAAAAPSPTPLTSQPSAQDFGTVRVEWGEQSTSLWIQNPGPDPVQLAAASVTGDGAFRITNDGCQGQQLSNGGGCSLGVGFDPPQGGAFAATVHVPVPGFDDLTVPLSGVGSFQRMALTPPALDFGSVAVGGSVVRALTVANTGTVPFGSLVTIPSGGDVGAFRVEHDSCSLQQLIGVDDACSISVRFTPLDPGSFDARLLLIGGDSEPNAVPMHGSAPAAPAASAPPAAASSTADPVVPASALLPAADVAFDAAGAAASVSRGRIDLGVARCVGAEQCSVSVRARVFALANRGSAIVSARTDVVLWSLRSGGARAGLALPSGLRGRPALLVARLRTHAAGHATGRRTLVVPLVSGAAARAMRAALRLRR